MVGVSGPDEHGGPAPGLFQAAQAIGRSSRARRTRRGVVVAVLTVAALTLSLEVYLRASDYRGRHFERSVNRTNRRWVELTRAGLLEEIDDPVRRYALRPGASCMIDGWSFRVTQHRTRGPDFPAAKPAQEKRLLCLGDSFAFGLWCDDDETLGARLARAASEAEARAGTDVTWRAIDLGVPGYHSGQQLRALEQDGLALDPDVVVLYFNTNDIEREGFFYDGELGVLRRDFLPLPTWLRRRLWWSHLYGWIVSAHRNLVESGPTPHLDPSVPYAHTRADNQAATRDAIARIADLCRERDIGLFFVDQPLMTYLGDTRRRDWSILPLVAWAEQMRTDLGLPGVSLLGWMRGYADGVDRMEGLGPDEEPPPPDFLLDAYFADERVQDAVRAARERARAAGESWEELTFAQRMSHFARLEEAIPEDIDFHLTGEAYGHIARIVYPKMQAAGLLP